MKIEVLKNKDFPPLLKEIPNVPKSLYIRGVVPDWSGKFLTVVGSRKYTQYGKEALEYLIAGLRGYPITIVSGLALGIDSIAHRAALGAGLRTIAVPGSGLDPKVLYPSSHKALAEKIIESGGCLLSEFEPMFKATMWGFPQRNRILAGIAHATLIVEAEIKSGTLITSKFATDYNRDVFTIPGSIFSKNSDGPHMLLRLGATPIRSSEDILEAFGLATDETRKPKQDSLFAECSPEEKEVLKHLNEPIGKDDLIRLIDRPVSETNTVLAMLELKGLIKESLGQIHLI